MRKKERKREYESTEKIADDGLIIIRGPIRGEKNNKKEIIKIIKESIIERRTFLNNNEEKRVYRY